MSDEVEVETKDLQETIEEIHRDREEREEEVKRDAWTRWIALSTALLAAFAAVAALESGGLANEGMMNQLQASDKWSEYQSSREKSHLYTVAATTLLDAHQVPDPEGPKSSTVKLGTETPGQRLREYLDQVDKEVEKQKDIQDEAKKLEKEAEAHIEHHHAFAYSVALLQVAIALGAVAALTRIKAVWLVSSILGVVGIVLFVKGFV